MGASRDFLTFFPAHLWRSGPPTDFDAKWLKRRAFTQGCAFCSKNRNFSYPLIFRAPKRSKFCKFFDLEIFRSFWPLTLVQFDKLKFFFYCICCSSLITSNIIDSESGVTICNQLRIRRPNTWRHWASDHSTRHKPLPIHIGDPLEQTLYLQPFSRDNGQQTYRGHDVDHSRSHDVIGHVTIHRSRDHLIPRYPFPIGAKISSAHWHNGKSSLRMRDITWCVPPM